jgi:GNAT superfamily N-acetyltransferase
MVEHRNGFYFEIVNESDMRPSLDKALKGLLSVCFPEDRALFSKSRYWNGVVPVYTVIVKNGQRIIGQLGIVSRTVVWGDEDITIAGVQSLCVTPDYRGRGLAKQLLAAAMEEAGRRGFPAGLLFCKPKLKQFYDGEGWETVDGRVFYMSKKYITMYLSLRENITNAGDIDLQGIDW